MNLNGCWDVGVREVEMSDKERDEKEVGSGGKVDAKGKKGSLDEKLAGMEWGKILVPFCPESTLSGVGRLIEPSEELWYRHPLDVKPVAGKRTLLHFGAVDYEATVWVNGREVGRHRGGHTPFSFDITQALGTGENTLAVRVHDEQEGWQLRGKQSLKPGTITYTRVTGIWQTVWLEQVPERSFEKIDVTHRKSQADGEEKIAFVVKPRLRGGAVSGEKLRVVVSSGDKEVARGEGAAGELAINIPEPKWWTPDAPHLYDLALELLDGGGKVVDSVKSYAALRSVGKIRDARKQVRIALNGKEIFLLGPLDQGWWPDGLLTPPSDEAMLSDLKFIKAAGFNMVRKHVKVENARYYYHCDRLGLAVWQDQVSAGMWERDAPAGASPPWVRLGPDPKDATWPEAAHQQWVTEYKAMVDFLRDHPSIIIWSPFNEAWGQHASMEIGKMASEYDPTRLVCLASGGNFWPVGDIVSGHEYPEPHFPMNDKRFKDWVKVMGETGGHGWVMEGHVWDSAKSWSYNTRGTLDDWQLRYRRTIDALRPLREFGLSAGVYTQTSDVENEVNGLLTYDRVPKVEASWLKEVNRRLMRGSRAASGNTGNGDK